MTNRITSLRTIEPLASSSRSLLHELASRLTNEAAHAWLREQVRIVLEAARRRAGRFHEDVVKIAGEQGRYAVGHGASLVVRSIEPCHHAGSVQCVRGRVWFRTSTIDGIVCRNKYNHLILLLLKTLHQTWQTIL